VLNSENTEFSIVVVDATKLNKLARFYYRGAGEIVRYFKILKRNREIAGSYRNYSRESVAEF